jgi:hypothetical protein
MLNISLNLILSQHIINCVLRKKQIKNWVCRYYDMYEYKIKSFDFVNASTTFQTYINVAFREYFDVFALVYINDILIFFKILEKHEKHMRVVLEKLLQYKLYIDIKKSKFNVVNTTFLRFIIIRENVKMNSNTIEMIIN